MPVSSENLWDPKIEDFLAWFDAPGQAELAHDPGETAPCPICGSPIGDRKRAKNVSIMAMDAERRDICLVYFMHAWCAEDSVTRELVDDAIMAWNDLRWAH